MDAETRQRMRAWEARFLACRTATELLASQSEIRASEGFIFRPFVRDASIAATFARARGIETVRLVSEEWPDFVLTVDGLEEGFEAVEADQPGRRRDLEYREIAKAEARGENTCIDDPEEDWLTPTQAAELLKTAAALKVSKHYRGSAGLVIYLNPSEYGFRHDEIVGVMADATADARDSFASVWVLWKGDAYQTWKAGSPVSPLS